MLRYYLICHIFSFESNSHSLFKRFINHSHKCLLSGDLKRSEYSHFNLELLIWCGCLGIKFRSFKYYSLEWHQHMWVVDPPRITSPHHFPTSLDTSPHHLNDYLTTLNMVIWNLLFWPPLPHRIKKIGMHFDILILVERDWACKC